MGKFTLSFTSPEKVFFFIFYDVIVKQKKKRSVYHYSGGDSGGEKRNVLIVSVLLPMVIDLALRSKSEHFFSPRHYEHIHLHCYGSSSSPFTACKLIMVAVIRR